MKAWIEEYSSRLITKVSMLFTVMILMHSIVGYSLDGRRVSCLVLYTIGYVGLSKIYLWQYKREVEEFNQKLLAFKRQYRSE